MTANEITIMDEAARLRIRYCKEPRLANAIEKAIADLISARDYSTKPFDGRPTKMEAIDFLRLVAMVLPEKITDTIVHECKSQFSCCNEASKIAIAQILGLSEHTEAIPFLEEVINGIADPKNGARQAAQEAIQVLKKEREIGWRNWPSQFIFRIIKAQV